MRLWQLLVLAITVGLAMGIGALVNPDPFLNYLANPRNAEPADMAFVFEWMSGGFAVGFTALGKLASQRADRALLKGEGAEVKYFFLCLSGGSALGAGHQTGSLWQQLAGAGMVGVALVGAVRLLARRGWRGGGRRSEPLATPAPPLDEPSSASRVRRDKR